MKEGLTDRSYKYKENNPDYQGEPIDDELANGPIANRGCTDIVWLILFIAFLIAMVAISSIGFKKGHPERLAAPFDSNGNQCGYDIEGYKYVYFLYNKLLKNQTKFYCVKKCPTSSNFTLEFGKSNNATENAIMAADTFFETPYKTALVVSVCVPFDDTLYKDISQKMSLPNMQKQIHDVKETWEIILACFGIAMGLGFVYMVLMKWCAGFIIWSALLLYLVFLGVLGFLCFREAKLTDDNAVLSAGGKEFGNKKEGLIAFAATFWTLCGLSLLLIICSFKKIRLAISITKVSAEFIRDVFYIYFVPIVMLFLSIGFYAYWIFTVIYLYSAGEIHKNELKTPFAGITWDENIQNFLFFMIVALVWISEFLFAVTFFIISSAACIWYFNQGPSHQTGITPVRTSICRVFLHLGSLAFGSFVLTFIIIVKWFLVILTKKLEASGETENPIVSCALKCAHCMIDCFQRFVRFLNKNAFIQIALQGKGFCSAAADGFYIVLRNAGRFAAVEGVGSIIILIGKLFITVLTSFIGYIIITKSDKYLDGGSNDIYSPVVPTIFFALVSYITSYYFMSIYGVASDAILQTFLVDEEVHRKKGQQSNHCPAELRQYLNDN